MGMSIPESEKTLLTHRAISQVLNGLRGFMSHKREDLYWAFLVVKHEFF